MRLMEAGGSAVDAVVGVGLAEGLCSMQNCGPGGGLVLALSVGGEAFALDARETAPAAASKDMFAADHKKASQGGLSMGVPGELMGYWEAHRRFGRLPWSEVVAPAAEMAARGVPVNARLARSLAALEAEIRASPHLARMILGDDPGSRPLPREGDRIRLPTLARTLERVGASPRGPWELYNGCLTDDFIADLAAQGSLITRADLANYRAEWVCPVRAPLAGGYELVSVPAPASGPLLAFLLRLLGPPSLRPSCPPESLYNARLFAEAFKHAYGLRSQLADPRFVSIDEVLKSKLESEYYIDEVRCRLSNCPESTWTDPERYGASFAPEPGGPGGTVNTAAIDPDGNAAAVTSTINTLFGSLVASYRTGILMNNEMDDFSSPSLVNSFSLPPSPANWIQPGKRPLSSMCPALVLAPPRPGGPPRRPVALAVGAAGGTHITTSTTQVICRHLWMGEDLKRAVDAPRLHHQLLPMVLKYEYGLSKVVVEGLERVGHRVVRSRPQSTVTAVARDPETGQLTAIYDHRRGGSTAGF